MLFPTLWWERVHRWLSDKKAKFCRIMLKRQMWLVSVFEVTGSKWILLKWVHLLIFDLLTYFLRHVPRLALLKSKMKRFDWFISHPFGHVVRFSTMTAVKGFSLTDFEIYNIEDESFIFFYVGIFVCSPHSLFPYWISDTLNTWSVLNVGVDN